MERVSALVGIMREEEAKWYLTSILCWGSRSSSSRGYKYGISPIGIICNNVSR
jgi:hypothetical protein